MSYGTQAAFVDCPYCGENFETTVDCSVDYQQYIEDCQVCCSPILFTVQVDAEGDAVVRTQSEDEG